jgi:cyanate permease
VAGVDAYPRYLRFLLHRARPVCDSLGLGGRARTGDRGPVPLALTLPLDYSADADEAGRLTAMTLFVGYVVAAVGPVAVGALRDATGGYAVPFVALATLSLGMLAVSPRFRPPMHGSPP